MSAISVAPGLTKSMIFSMISSMNTLQRITITLPTHTYEQLARTVPRGKISKFVAQAVSNHLTGQHTSDFLAEFEAIQKKLKKELPPISTKAILEAIHKGRT